jgi:radical SAM superfamily enzyme YgiQ (UPF0313 family)
MSLRSPGDILLVSCYELGHQPMCVALPLGFLERAGFHPDAMDIAVEAFDTARIAQAKFIAISVPMHTALRLGVKVAERAREINPDAVICFYGLYAALNADYLLEHAGDYCIGGEVESPLVALVEALDARNGEKNGNGLTIDGIIQRGGPVRPFLRRLPFAQPARRALPTLDRYAKLEHEGQSRVTGYVEASRGCLHLCTHCPIPPVYGGRFFVVPEEIVLEDIGRQVAGGATHVTFGDPDFLNGPGHALSVVRAVHAKYPRLTFDVTTKVEHILKRGAILPELGKLGCLFLISAVESVSPVVLDILEKNHTKADIEEAIKLVRAAGIAPRPTWVPFTPWTTLGDYLEMLAFIEELGLIDNVDPVQYTIRLLIPPGSYILKRPELQPHLGALDQASFSYKWIHPDPRMDRLQKEISALVEKDVSDGVDAGETFYRVWSLAAGRKRGTQVQHLAPDRIRAPRLSEPWFC